MPFTKRLGQVGLFIYVCVLNIFWGGAPSVSKWVFVEADPRTVALVRYLSAFMFLSFFAGKAFRDFMKADPVTKLLVIIMGLLTFGIGPSFAFRGLALTGGGEAAFLIGVEPVITCVFAYFFLKEKLTPLRIFALVLALGGILIMSPPGSGSFAGNMFYLVDVVINASYSTLAVIVIRRGMSALSLTVLALAFGSLVLAPQLPKDVLWESPRLWLGGAIYLGFLCTAYGYFAWVKASERLPLNLMALSLFVQPVAGNLIAFLLLKETPGLSLGIGGILILAAMALSIGPGMIKEGTKRLWKIS